jgi:hypothetical protein
LKFWQIFPFFSNFICHYNAKICQKNVDLDREHARLLWGEYCIVKI